VKSGGTSQAPGQDAREVRRDAAAGDVGEAADQREAALRLRAGELLDDREIAAVGAHEGRAGLVLELVDVVVGGVAGDLEEELAGERVAVGVEAVGGDAHEDVAGFDGLAGEDAGAVDAADDGSGEIVLAVGVEARHLGGFAADERAAIGFASFREATDDGFHDVIFQPAGGQVIEEK
jgi:hypothetical protein